MYKVFGTLSKAAITALAFLPMVASAQFFPPPEGTFGPPPGGESFGPPPGGMTFPDGQMTSPTGRTFGSGQFGAPEGMMPPSGQMMGQEGQMMKPPPGMMMGPDQGMMGAPGSGGEFGQFGPSEEEIEKMEQQRLEQERKMKMRGLHQMKRGLKQFVRMLERFKSKIDKLDKQGVPIPAECRQNVEQALSTVQNLLTTEDPDVIETFDFSELQAIGEVLQECGPKIEQAAHLPRIIKQINAQINRLEKRLKSIETRAARANLDLGTILEQVRAQIAAFKTDLEQLKTAEDPFELLESLPEQFDDINQRINSLEAVFQLQKAIRNLNGQISRFEQIVKRLERKGEGAEERALLEELKQSVTELKGIKLTEETLELLPEIIGRAFELVEELGEALSISKGPAPLFKLKGVPKVLPDINVPQFEKLMMESRARKKYFAKSGARAAERRERAKVIASDN